MYKSQHCLSIQVCGRHLSSCSVLKYWLENEKQEVKQAQQYLIILLSCFRARMSGSETWYWSPLLSSVCGMEFVGGEERGWGSRISDLSLVMLLKVMRAFIHSDYKCRTDGAGEEARGRKRIKVGCLRVKTALRGELCLSCLG